jgi:hypothetical protein
VLQSPIGDILPPVAAVLVVDVEGEALMTIDGRTYMEVGNSIGDEYIEGRGTVSNLTYYDCSVRGLRLRCRVDAVLLIPSFVQNLIKIKPPGGERPVKATSDSIGIVDGVPSASEI